jgi:hypothetical protein
MEPGETGIIAYTILIGSHHSLFASQQSHSGALIVLSCLSALAEMVNQGKSRFGFDI